MATVVQTRANPDVTGAALAYTPASPFTTGNLVVLLLTQEADPLNIPLGTRAFIGGLAMTLVDEAADETTGVGYPNGVWALFKRVITGTEASSDVTFDDGAGGALGLPAGLVEVSGATSVTGDIQSMDSSTVDGALPDTYQVNGTFAADLNLHVLVGHYLSSAALAFTTAGLSNTHQAAQGSAGNRGRAMVGTSLSATNPSEDISGTVGAAYTASYEARAAVVALTFTAAETPVSPDFFSPFTYERANAKALPYALNTRMVRDVE